MRSVKVRLAALGLICALAACPAFSQALNGTLLGTVTDSTGAVVPNVKVALAETNTGISRTTETSAAGNYVFSNVPQGTYSVTAELTGFKKGVRSGVPVLVNTSVRVDLTLEPGNVTDVINVTAEAAVLQTDRADTNRKIEQTSLENLPVSTPGGRNFQALINFVPGTTRAYRPHSEFFNPQNTLSTQVNGQCRLANNLQFEGVDNNERTGLLKV